MSKICKPSNYLNSVSGNTIYVGRSDNTYKCPAASCADVGSQNRPHPDVFSALKQAGSSRFAKEAMNIVLTSQNTPWGTSDPSFTVPSNIVSIGTLNGRATVGGDNDKKLVFLKNHPRLVLKGINLYANIDASCDSGVSDIQFGDGQLWGKYKATASGSGKLLGALKDIVQVVSPGDLSPDGYDNEHRVLDDAEMEITKSGNQQVSAGRTLFHFSGRGKFKGNWRDHKAEEDGADIVAKDDATWSINHDNVDLTARPRKAGETTRPFFTKKLADRSKGEFIGNRRLITIPKDAGAYLALKETEIKDTAEYISRVADVRYDIGENTAAFSKLSASDNARASFTRRTNTLTLRGEGIGTDEDLSGDATVSKYSRDTTGTAGSRISTFRQKDNSRKDAKSSGNQITSKGIRKDLSGSARLSVNSKDDTLTCEPTIGYEGLSTYTGNASYEATYNGQNSSLCNNPITGGYIHRRLIKDEAGVKKAKTSCGSSKIIYAPDGTTDNGAGQTTVSGKGTFETSTQGGFKDYIRGAGNGNITAKLNEQRDEATVKVLKTGTRHSIEGFKPDDIYHERKTSGKSIRRASYTGNAYDRNTNGRMWDSRLDGDAVSSFVNRNSDLSVAPPTPGQEQQRVVNYSINSKAILRGRMDAASWDAPGSKLSDIKNAGASPADLVAANSTFTGDMSTSGNVLYRQAFSKSNGDHTHGKNTSTFYDYNQHIGDATHTDGIVTSYVGGSNTGRTTANRTRLVGQFHNFRRAAVVPGTRDTTDPDDSKALQINGGSGFGHNDASVQFSQADGVSIQTDDTTVDTVKVKMQASEVTDSKADSAVRIKGPGKVLIDGGSFSTGNLTVFKADPGTPATIELTPNGNNQGTSAGRIEGATYTEKDPTYEVL